MDQEPLMIICLLSGIWTALMFTIHYLNRITLILEKNDKNK